MFLLGSLSSGTVVARGTAGSRARRGSSTAPLPGHAAAAHGTGVAVPPIAEELLTLTAPLMPRTEPVLTAARLANRKVGRRALGRHLRVFVLVIGVARRAARLLDVVADHRDHGVVGDTSLARTVIVQNVTKPRLALLHQKLPTDPRWQGKGLRKARLILAELLSGWQIRRLMPVPPVPASVVPLATPRPPPMAPSIAVCASRRPTREESRSP